MEAARGMLHDQDLPMHIWAEAARTTVYVHNHTPHRVLKNKTLEEVFSRKKPKVIHLRIFGCLVYIHTQRKRGPILILLGGRVYSKDTMTLQRPIEYTSQDLRISTSANTYHSMKTRHTLDRENYLL